MKATKEDKFRGGEVLPLYFRAHGCRTSSGLYMHATMLLLCSSGLKRLMGRRQRKRRNTRSNLAREKRNCRINCQKLGSNHMVCDHMTNSKYHMTIIHYSVTYFLLLTTTTHSNRAYKHWVIKYNSVRLVIVPSLSHLHVCGKGVCVCVCVCTYSVYMRVCVLACVHACACVCVLT